MASTTRTDDGRRPDGAAPAPGEPVVHSVTTARKSVADDRAHRNRNYLVSMLVRTVCFVLACLVPGPLRWVFAAGAVFLPYIAVVFANAVNVHPEGDLTPAHGGALAAGAPATWVLDDAPHGAPDTPLADLSDHDDLHVGEVIDSRHHDRHDDEPARPAGGHAAGPA